jgi:hypothetical protein
MTDARDRDEPLLLVAVSKVLLFLSADLRTGLSFRILAPIVFLIQDGKESK